jgi:chromosome segregation ATPase
VLIAAGKNADLNVVTERPVSESVALLDADVNTIFAYSKNAELSPALKVALLEIIARRRKVSDLQGQRAGLEGELKAIADEQGRIRENMKTLDRQNALYGLYVKKLTDQEARIERIRAEVARLRDAENAAQAELRKFLDGLDMA